MQKEVAPSEFCRFMSAARSRTEAAFPGPPLGPVAFRPDDAPGNDEEPTGAASGVVDRAALAAIVDSIGVRRKQALFFDAPFVFDAQCSKLRIGRLSFQTPAIPVSLVTLIQYVSHL